MAEKTNKQYPKVVRNDETARVIAGLYGVSDRWVRKVISGDAEDDEILAACIEYKAGKNILIETIKEMIPFTKSFITPVTSKSSLNEAN